MIERIDWNSAKITDIEEIKKGLVQLIELIENGNALIKTRAFGDLINKELLSIRFALYTADFSNTIRIGKELEQIYHQWIEDFKKELKRNA